MKFLLILMTLLIDLQVTYSEIITKDIISILESGNFKKAEEIIEKLEDDYRKKFITSLYYLYLGEYEKSYNYIADISSNNKINNLSSEELFFFYYIPYMYQLFKNGYERYESQHFVLFLKGRDKILKDLALKNLEKIYETYTEKFKVKLQDKIRVEIYNRKEEFCNASTLFEDIVNKTGVVGICKFNRIMILSPENLPYGYRWIDTLAHEFIHFLLNRITDFKYPLYLHEGTARYFDTLYRSSISLCFTSGNLRELLEAKKNNRLIPFESFSGSLVYLESAKQIEIAFVELASFIDYLINNFTEQKFIDFVNNYSSSKDEKILYKKIFNKEYKELLDAWMKNIEEKSSLAEKYPGALMDIKILNSQSEKELITLDVYQYIELGDKFLERKDYKSALYQYKKSQQQQPYNPIIMTRIARVLMLLKKYEEAEEILKKCIDANPNFATAYELIIELYYETSQYFNALEYYTELLHINPFNYKIRKIIAEIYSDLGKLHESLNEYKMINILIPEDKNIISIIESINRYLETKQKIKK